MKCKEIRERMPDLAAGLSTADPEMETHMQSCSACAGELEEFRKTMALLDEWTAPEPSPYFDTRLRARLREEMAASPAQSWLGWFRKPALAVSLAVLMVLSISLIRTDRETHAVGKMATVAVEPGSAVGDLQALDKNNEIYSDFDLLDDLQVQKDVSANP